MGNVKKFKQEVEAILIGIYGAIGMDRPTNHEEILDFIANDVAETADPVEWHSGDVGIAFRRWIEKQSEIVGHFCPEPIYFHVVKSGWNGELQRQEVQIHAGENANIFLIKNDQGFIVDVYGQNDLVESMTIWEDDIEAEIDEEMELPDILGTKK
ncbi:MAG: hypothetical protein M0R03_16405 [Novosphingobium sp.]|nr:hypothetical protein [Novosphingobium sp.]